MIECQRLNTYHLSAIIFTKHHSLYLLHETLCYERIKGDIINLIECYITKHVFSIYIIENGYNRVCV